MKKEMKIEKVEQLIEGYKNIYVPTFEEWYHVNSKGYKSRNDKPYTLSEAEEVYAALLESGFDFPYWNE